MDNVLIDNLIKLGMAVLMGGLIGACSLQVIEHHQSKTGDTIIGTWRAIGLPENHEKFVELMMKDKGVKELVY